eukprot:s247_g40.t1
MDPFYADFGAQEISHKVRKRPASDLQHLPCREDVRCFDGSRLILLGERKPISSHHRSHMRAIRSSLVCLAALVHCAQVLDEAHESCEAEALKVELVQTKVRLQRGDVASAHPVDRVDPVEPLELLDLGTTSTDFIAGVDRLEQRVRALEQRLGADA